MALGSFLVVDSQHEVREAVAPTCRELLSQALEGSHAVGFEGGWRETGRYEAPFTIPPPPEGGEGEPGR